jgi:hypothetical protein
MFEKMRQIALASLLLFASLYAQSVSVWTLDEQLPSDNLTVLRFRVQNTGQQTIRGLELHYRVKQDWSEIAPAESYYVPGGNMQWFQLSGGEALLKIYFPNVVLEPMEELSNSSGFSVGLHTTNWYVWNKQEHYSQPVSSIFTLTDRISVYSNGLLLNGSNGGTALDLACPEVWFLEIQTDSVKIGWLPSNSHEEQTALELRSFNGASLEVDLTQATDSGGYKEWSGAFPVQFENHGELWLNCSGKMKAYFAYGLAPENAEPAVEARLWENKSSFVEAHTGMGYNMGIMPGDRYIVESGEFGRRIADWKLYRPWEAPDLPKLPAIAFPGLGETILPETPDDSLTFAWASLEGFYLYRLHIVRDSIFGDTLRSLLVPGTEVRLPMPPPGVYVWWAEPVSPVSIAPMGWFSSIVDGAKSFGSSVLNISVQLSPVLNYLVNDDVSITQAFMQSLTSMSPLGIINIAAGGVDAKKKTLKLTPIRARKDTDMLDLGWAGDIAAIDSGWWDSPNLNTVGPLRENEKNRCWAVAVQQMNWYFGGSLTQDEIVYNGKSSGRAVEDHFPHGLTVDASGFPDIIPTMEFALGVSTLDYFTFKNWKYQLARGISSLAELPSLGLGWQSQPPSPYTVIANIEAGIPMVIAQVNQGYNGMHMMVIDGYRIQLDGSVYLHFIGTNNRGEKDDSEWRYYASIYGLGIDMLLYQLEQEIINILALIARLVDKDYKLSLGANFYTAYYVPPPNAKGIPTDSLLKKHSDDDGINDFDEIKRFGTDPNNSDSDGDGINDKKEIAYYTRLNVSADIDGDGLRAELDVDSDGDGDCDGDEDANKNGRLDGEETNMMDSTSRDTTRLNCRIKPIALLATEQININDRAYCMDNDSIYCPIVSMGLKGGNAVQLGVSAKVGSILAGSSVWLRSNASVLEYIHTAGTLTLQGTTPQVPEDTKQKYKRAFMLAQVYRPLLSNFNMGVAYGNMQIPSGQTVTLNPGIYKQSIVVSSGSVLRLRPGKYQMGSLTVQSGGKIELLESGNIALDIAGLFRWDGSFQGNDIQNAASRLQVRVLGSQNIFLNTSFGGFITAPNAHVVVGQADKDHAGQIYARRITVHQNVRFLWVQPGSRQTNMAAFNRGVIYAHSNN